jgi:hypothetical protein
LKQKVKATAKLVTNGPPVDLNDPSTVTLINETLFEGTIELQACELTP